MEISFLEDKVGDLNDFKWCKRKWGEPMAKAIARRLAQVTAASSLHELVQPGFPGKWHDLTGDRKRQFSANLVGPHKLICVLDGDPAEYMESEQINLKKVVGLLVVEIVDYH